MTIIGWKEVYETGILALDNEHRELVAAVNRLFEAVRDKRGDEVLTETLGTLEDYVLKHFQNEERLLEQYKYPDRMDRCALHPIGPGCRTSHHC